MVNEKSWNLQIYFISFTHTKEHSCQGSCTGPLYVFEELLLLIETVEHLWIIYHCLQILYKLLVSYQVNWLKKIKQCLFWLNTLLMHNSLLWLWCFLKFYFTFVFSLCFHSLMELFSSNSVRSDFPIKPSCCCSVVKPTFLLFIHITKDILILKKKTLHCRLWQWSKIVYFWSPMWA